MLATLTLCAGDLDALFARRADANRPAEVAWQEPAHPLSSSRRTTGIVGNLDEFDQVAAELTNPSRDRVMAIPLWGVSEQQPTGVRP